MPPSRPADAVVVTPALLRGWPLPIPGAEADKNARGTVVVVGGTSQTPGAVLLAGVAALRAGAGRLSLATAAPVAVALGVAVPEALVAGVDTGQDGGIDPSAASDIASLTSRATAVLVGPGLSDPDATAGLLAALLPQLPADAMVVLDALALGCLGNQPTLAEPVAGRLVLTPNAAEAARLLGSQKEQTEDDVPGTAAEAARRFDAVVALHGFVACPDGRCWSDETGHVGLGTSGSGDVLAGLVAGLAARGADAAQAAVWGTHLHGAAGDRLAARIGRLGFLARELLDEAPVVLAELQT